MSPILRVLLVALLAPLALVMPSGAAAEHGNADQASPNMLHMANRGRFPPTNSDLAFWQGGSVRGPHHDLAIAGNYDGFRIFDINDPENPVLVSDFHCRGNQGDGSIHKAHDQLLYIQSVDNPVTSDDCATAVDTPIALFPIDGGFARLREPGFEGLRIFDITNPETPVHIASVATSCGSHTHTTIPDDRNQRLIIYVSSQPAGSQRTPPTADFGGPRCTQPHAKLPIVEVPYRNPAAARVLKEQPLDADTQPFSFRGTSFGIACHDIQAFYETPPFSRSGEHLRMAMAACQSESQLWDITDPANPTTVGPGHTHIRNPFVNYHHSGAFTWDGNVFVINDESFVGGCRGPEDTEGNLWIYKAVPAGTPTAPLLGRYTIPRPQPPPEYCSTHNQNFIPTNEGYFGVSAFYEGGTSVYDISGILEREPVDPTVGPVPLVGREIAFFDPTGVDGRRAGVVWSSYWYNDYVFTNDITRNFDVFKLLGENGRLVDADGNPAVTAGETETTPTVQQYRARKFHHMNPQVQETFQAIGHGR